MQRRLYRLNLPVPNPSTDACVDDTILSKFANEKLRRITIIIIKLSKDGDMDTKVDEYQ